MDKAKVRIVVDEDLHIVGRLDEIASAEGLSRADILRRAIRRMLLSMSSVPTNGNIPEPKQTVAEAA